MRTILCGVEYCLTLGIFYWISPSWWCISEEVTLRMRCLTVLTSACGYDGANSPTFQESCWWIVVLCLFLDVWVLPSHRRVVENDGWCQQTLHLTHKPPPLTCQLGNVSQLCWKDWLTWIQKTCRGLFSTVLAPALGWAAWPCTIRRCTYSVFHWVSFMLVSSLIYGTSGRKYGQNWTLSGTEKAGRWGRTVGKVNVIRESVAYSMT